MWSELKKDFESLLNNSHNLTHSDLPGVYMYRQPAIKTKKSEDDEEE